MTPRCLLTAFLLLTVFASFSQEGDYSFQRVTNLDGLSDNHVNAFCKDHRGFIWIGTNSGLNRYDGYTFKIFHRDDLDSNSLTDDYVRDIHEGPGDKLFINTYTGGINVYDLKKRSFVPKTDAWLKSRNIARYGVITMLTGKDGNMYFVYKDNGIFRLEARPGAVAARVDVHRAGKAPGSAFSAVLDTAGKLWVSYVDGNLERLDLSGNSPALHSDILQFGGLQRYSVFSLYIDAANRLWIYSQDNLSGLWKFDQPTGRLTHFSKDSGSVRLSSNNILDIGEDAEGKLWLATDHGGINILDADRLTVRYISHSDEERSLPENTVTTIYRDDIGGMWLGTLKSGAGYFQRSMLRFPLYKHQPGQPASLPFNDANAFAEDKAGNIWIGTNGGGLIYFDRQVRTFTTYRHEKNNENSLSNDVIVSLLTDHLGRLWIGTYQGGLDCLEGKKFTHFRHDDDDTTSLADNRVLSLWENLPGGMWVGTLGGGLDRLDIATGKFFHNRFFPSSPFAFYYAPALAMDSSSNLWSGTGFGINVLKANSGRPVYYSTANNHLADNIVHSLNCDHLGNMWVATGHGLSVLPPGRDTFQDFYTRDGLPSNQVLGVIEDKNHLLWVSSMGGLSRVTVSSAGDKITIHCLNFDEHDGLQSREFSRNAVFRTREGELIFGGVGGFNLFSPDSVILNNHPPPIALTGLQLSNKDAPLAESLAANGELVLSPDQNNFTFEFAALSFINSRKNRYAYRLVGFDKEWITSDGNERRAVYTNVDPGDYTFRVKGSNSDGVWNDEGLSIHIVIKPPFWKTGWAYAFYALLVAILLYIWRLRVIRRARARFANDFTHKR